MLCTNNTKQSSSMLHTSVDTETTRETHEPHMRVTSSRAGHSATSNSIACHCTLSCCSAARRRKAARTNLRWLQLLLRRVNFCCHPPAVTSSSAAACRCSVALQLCMQLANCSADPLRNGCLQLWTVYAALQLPYIMPFAPAACGARAAALYHALDHALYLQLAE